MANKTIKITEIFTFEELLPWLTLGLLIGLPLVSKKIFDLTTSIFPSVITYTFFAVIVAAIVAVIIKIKPT
ncbi:hypothetical protein [Sulfurimonas sp.]|jgi:hypothetical protein|uniref:hypothetical protein n=1 Tax=Sulfurimonas sp. TaxID=2022749 RepID=UPI0025DDD2A6|nr:hypothetical protein [Sulfurimonas sp.]MBT5935585.1 hypothetical protein [Sulfurimonas sp.]